MSAHLTPAQIKYWDGVFAKTVETPEWKEEIERAQLTGHYLASGATGEFLAAENMKLEGIMNRLGLSKQASAR